jgi:hypothetical protein
MIVLICLAIVGVTLLWSWRTNGGTRSLALMSVTLAAATLVFLSAPSRAGAQVSVGLSVNVGPPALPAFYQPYATQPNQIWQPGYWGWGTAGYFWVPGIWVMPMQPGFLWTPGYWGWNGAYGWHPGYWGRNVGFYGGINYGYGYYGSGYRGGRWYGNAFRYNTSVSNVNTTLVRDNYIDRGAYVNQSQWSRVSYNGGLHGIGARPSAAQIAVEHQQRYPMTAVQNEHVAIARENRSYLASVNHGAPSQVSVSRPLSANNHPAGFTPVRATDRSPAPVQHEAVAVQHAAPPVQHHAAPPVQHHAAQPMQHSAAPVHPSADVKPRGSPVPIDIVYWNGLGN